MRCATEKKFKQKINKSSNNCSGLATPFYDQYLILKVKTETYKARRVKTPTVKGEFSRRGGSTLCAETDTMRVGQSAHNKIHMELNYPSLSIIYNTGKKRTKETWALADINSKY